VPDEPTIQLWRQSIEGSTRTGRFHPETDTLVLDGIPRNVHQAQMLKETLDVVGIFYLRSTNIDNLVHRMQRRAIKENRLDDASLEVIRQRLKTYEKDTKPVLNFYGSKFVHKINADQTPAKVLFDILKHIVKV
jgi:adenylate kinase